MSPSSDRETLLVVLAQQGRVNAFEQLMALYERRLLYYIRAQTGDMNSALDISQETWLDVWNSLARLRIAGAFRPWLYQIAHRRILQHYRRHARHERETKQDVAEVDIPAPEIDLAAAIDLAALRQTVNRLRSRWREVIVLHYIAELSVEEIAVAIGVSAGTVKSRLYYARREMKRLWADEVNHV